MTEKGRVLQWLRSVSASTVAGFIGSRNYAAIDNALSTAALMVSAMSEGQAAGIQTMADYAELIRSAAGIRQEHSENGGQRKLCLSFMPNCHRYMAGVYLGGAVEQRHFTSTAQAVEWICAHPQYTPLVLTEWDDKTQCFNHVIHNYMK